MAGAELEKGLEYAQRERSQANPRGEVKGSQRRSSSEQRAVSGRGFACGKTRVAWKLFFLFSLWLGSVIYSCRALIKSGTRVILTFGISTSCATVHGWVTETPYFLFPLSSVMPACCNACANSFARDGESWSTCLIMSFGSPGMSLEASRSLSMTCWPCDISTGLANDERDPLPPRR